MGDVEICNICEKRTTGYYRFTEEEDVKLTVCMECITLGLRWIVNQARSERELEAADGVVITRTEWNEYRSLKRKKSTKD